MYDPDEEMNIYKKHKKEDEATWGIHMNPHDNMPSQPCPSWAKGFEQTVWDGIGVIIWDKTADEVRCLSPHQALDVLDDMRESPDWKEKPFHLSWNSYTIPFSEEERHARKSNQNLRNRSGGVNAMVLMPERTQELFLFLNSHEGEIRASADEHIREVKKVLGRAYALILGWAKDV